MADVMTRDEVLRYVVRRISDPKFASSLSVRDAEGSRPIVPVIASDSCSYMLSEIANFGGSANVVVGMPGGLIGFSVVNEGKPRRSKKIVGSEDLEDLDADCTVGVFAARMLADGGENRYRFRRTSQGGRVSAPKLLEA